MTVWGIPSPPQFLEYSEVKTITNYVTNHSHHKQRDVLLLETLWESGARISEVLALTPEGIGINSLIVPNLKQKVRKKRAIEQGFSVPHKEVIVTTKLCNELRDFSRKIPEGTTIFRGNRNRTKPLNYRYVHRLITGAAENTGILKAKKRRLGPYSFTGAWPHLFRHGSAMRILDETGDLKLVQRQLGHASIVTTEMYAQIRPPLAKKQLSEVKWRE